MMAEGGNVARVFGVGGKQTVLDEAKEPTSCGVEDIEGCDPGNICSLGAGQEPVR